MKFQCACGNFARLDSDQCTPCRDAAQQRGDREAAFQRIRDAMLDMHSGPMLSFAEAVTDYLEIAAAP